MTYSINASKDPICATYKSYVNYNSRANILGGSGSFQPYQKLNYYSNPLPIALGQNVINNSGGNNMVALNWKTYTGPCECSRPIERFSWGAYGGSCGYNGPVNNFSWPSFPALQTQTWATMGFDSFAAAIPAVTVSPFATMGFDPFGGNPFLGCGCNGYNPGYNYFDYGTGFVGYPTVGYYGYGLPYNIAADGYYTGNQGSYTFDGQANSWSRKGYATADASGAFIQDNSAKKSTNINLGGFGKIAYSDHGRAISLGNGAINYSKIDGKQSIDLSTVAENLPAIVGGLKTLLFGQNTETTALNPYTA